MGYKIITDSTIDMDHKMIEELGLTVVPLRFTIDGKTYKDKADLSDMPTETFYAKLREGKMSTTSRRSTPTNSHGSLSLFCKAAKTFCTLRFPAVYPAPAKAPSSRAMN